MEPQPVTTARVRRRKPDAGPADTPPDKPFAVKLVRGRLYHLIGREELPERQFQRGVWSEVDEHTYRYLSENAIDQHSARDPEFGVVTRHLRKFTFAKGGEIDAELGSIKHEEREFDDE